MKIAVVKETKKHEYRVGMTPSCVQAYREYNHSVTIESSAGDGAGFPDDEYREAGAIISNDKKKIITEAEMIVKVKEPTPEECELFREGQILYTYLHLAPNKKLTKALLQKKIIGIAYETIQLTDGTLPCLMPMSEIAGRQAIQEGAKYLEKSFGGRGILLGGVPGVRRGKVAILGGGVVGLNSAKIAVGIGADVHILDIDYKRLTYLDDIFGSSIQTLFSNPANIKRCLTECDVLVGAVLLPGASTPNLVQRKHLALMKPGAVIVDVSVDQGGCIETTHPTTHDNPIYVVDNLVHYCVANMPGAVALTSTLALTNHTLLYGLKLANQGLKKAVETDPALKHGVNICKGYLTNKAVANSLNLPYHELTEDLTTEIPELDA